MLVGYAGWINCIPRAPIRLGQRKHCGIPGGPYSGCRNLASATASKVRSRTGASSESARAHPSSPSTLSRLSAGSIAVAEGHHWCSPEEQHSRRATSPPRIFGASKTCLRRRASISNRLVKHPDCARNQDSSQMPMPQRTPVSANRRQPDSASTSSQSARLSDQRLVGRPARGRVSGPRPPTQAPSWSHTPPVPRRATAGARGDRNRGQALTRSRRSGRSSCRHRQLAARPDDRSRQMRSRRSRRRSAQRRYRVGRGCWFVWRIQRCQPGVDVGADSPKQRSRRLFPTLLASGREALAASRVR